jgi:hypothetical protein
MVEDVDLLRFLFLIYGMLRMLALAAYNSTGF